jgi:hypothetical protein
MFFIATAKKQVGTAMFYACITFLFLKWEKYIGNMPKKEVNNDKKSERIRTQRHSLFSLEKTRIL